MEPYKLDGFDDVEDVFAQFTTPDSERVGVNIIAAYYSYENYEGNAWVLFERDGELYEVNGGHCSCYGLEDQWSPEPVSVEALRYRIDEGIICYGLNNAEVAAALDWWEDGGLADEIIYGKKKNRSKSVLKFQKYSTGKNRKNKYEF